MRQFVSIRTSATSGAESYLRSCVGAFCVRLDPSLDELNDVKTAVSEAVTNVVVHAYPDRKTDGIFDPVAPFCASDADPVVVVNVALDESTVYIEVLDDGIGIEDVARARSVFFTTGEDGERSGIGFTVMEAFMDSLVVENRPEGGLRVAMQKKIGGQPTARKPATEGVRASAN